MIPKPEVGSCGSSYVGGAVWRVQAAKVAGSTASPVPTLSTSAMRAAGGVGSGGDSDGSESGSDSSSNEDERSSTLKVEG